MNWIGELYPFVYVIILFTRERSSGRRSRVDGGVRGGRRAVADDGGHGALLCLSASTATVALASTV